MKFFISWFIIFIDVFAGYLIGVSNPASSGDWFFGGVVLIAISSISMILIGVRDAFVERDAKPDAKEK